MIRRLKFGRFFSRAMRHKSVFFIHIAKTGGVTVETLLKRNWIPEKVCPHYFPRDYLLSGKDIHRYNFFCGHAPYYIRSIFEEPCYTFTILREPVARTISAYEHVMRDHQHELHNIAKLEAPTILEFMEHPRIKNNLINPQTRFLGIEADFRSLHRRLMHGEIAERDALEIMQGWHRDPCTDATLSVAKHRLDSMDRFGLTQNLGELINLVQQDLQITLDRNVPVLNSNPLEKCFSSRYTKEEIQAIVQKNKYDIELYSYAEQKRNIQALA